MLWSRNAAACAFCTGCGCLRRDSIWQACDEIIILRRKLTVFCDHLHAENNLLSLNSSVFRKLAAIFPGRRLCRHVVLILYFWLKNYTTKARNNSQDESRPFYKTIAAGMRYARPVQPIFCMASGLQPGSWFWDPRPANYRVFDWWL